MSIQTRKGSRVYSVSIPESLAKKVDKRLKADGLTESEFARVAFARAVKKPIERDDVPAVPKGRPKLSREADVAP